MKPETLVGIVGMLVALVLYSIGSWGAFRAKSMRKNDVLFLIGGVLFDMIGTGGMYVAAGNKFLWDAAHTWGALLAFFLMVIVAILGLWAVGWKKDALSKRLASVVLGPWAIWAIVFVWGFLQRPGT